MKKLIILLFAVITCNGVCAQSCLPEGITFKTQAQIDNFQTIYPGCKEIKGNVKINNESLGREKILNLNGLSVLHSIGGNLIIEHTQSLTSLNGLNNLSYIGGNLSIEWQSALTNLIGLTNLDFIGGGFVIYYNNSLQTLTGLENLKSIGGEFFIRESNLNSLSGLENLTIIGGSVNIHYNDLLTSLSALDNLKSIAGEITIFGNPMLTSLTGLENIDASLITKLNIFNNKTLSSCDAQNICNYLTSLKTVINVYSNAPGCNSPFEVANNCGIVLPCLPFGNYYFNNQSDIDSFAVNYPNCTELPGNVSIWGNIVNLDGLANITSVSGNLEINLSDSLTNFNGLRNLLFVGGNLTIRGGTTWYGGCIYPALKGLAGLEKLTAIGGSLSLSCLKINDFTGLGNLKSIGGDFGVYYTDIKNFTGLEKLSSIGGSFHLGYFQNHGGSAEGNNQYLTSFAGLNKLSYIGGNFEIWGQHALTSLTGLDKLDSIKGDVLIMSNLSLITFTGLDSLSFIGGFLHVIRGNSALASLTGLENLKTTGELLIQSNNSLTNLTGLENLRIIKGSLNISNNPALSSLNGLVSLNAIWGSLDISNNSALTSLKGLDILRIIDGNLKIFNDSVLTSLTGLENLELLGGSINVESNVKLTSLKGLENISPGTIKGLYIGNNPMLTDCDIKSLCKYLARPNTTILINHNAPGCNSHEEVNAACLGGVGLESIFLVNAFTIYPNPATNKISIEFNSNLPGETTICIFNINGALLRQEKFQSQNLIELDVSTLAKGFYLVKIQTKKGVETKKLVVQ